MAVKARPFRDHHECLTELMAWLSKLVEERAGQGRLDMMFDEPEQGPCPTFLPSPSVAGSTRAETLFRRWEHRVNAGREANMVPPLIALGDAAGLDAFEYKLLALGLSAGLGVRFPVTDGAGSVRRAVLRMDITSLLDLLCDGLEERLQARRYFRWAQPVFANGLLALEDREYRSEEAFLRRRVEMPRRVFGAIIGDQDMDDTLSTYARLVDPVVTLDDVVLADAVGARVRSMLAAARDPGGVLSTWQHAQPIPHGQAITALFTGPAGTGKTLLAHGLAHALGKRLLHVNYTKLEMTSLDNYPLDRVLREAWLQNAIPFFDECEALFDRGVSLSADFLTSIEYYTGLVLFATNEWIKLDAAFERRILYHLPFGAPDARMRRRIWEKHLPDGLGVDEDVDAHELALLYDLTGGDIKNAVLLSMQAATARNPDAPTISQADVKEGAQAQVRTRMDMAHQVEPRVSLAQVVLPSATLEQVHEIVAATRVSSGVFSDWGFEKTVPRGRGMTVLFRGEPGTGKTLTAEAIAHALGRMLQQVNLSAIQSMWVGQTEKNIHDLFRHARAHASVLLFDEADGLFGRRVDHVRDATDRAANTGTNVLLQDVEEYEGLVILTTNLAGHLDRAFERRLMYRVDFPLPERQARAQIWQTLIPPECPLLEPVDWEALATRFELSGGLIKNAVLRAARMAMSNGRRGLRQADFWHAAEHEIRSLDRKHRSVGFTSS